MDEQVRYPQSRYQLSQFAEQQLLMRNQVNLVASLARLTGDTTDFSQVNRLLTGRLVNRTLSEKSVQQLLNLRTAVAFITSSPEGFDLVTFSHINDLVTAGIGLNGGELRVSPVVTLGTVETTVPVPDEATILRDLLTIRLKHGDYTDRALQALAYILRHQLFRDGNTATAFLVANLVLAKRGAGVLLLNPDQLAEFGWSLANFYRKNDDGLCQWLYHNALYGPEDLA